MTVDPIAKDVAWPENYNDVPKLKNNKSAPNDIQDSCTNTDIITKYGDSSKYPEAWAAGNYKPTGTPENKVSNNAFSKATKAMALAVLMTPIAGPIMTSCTDDIDIDIKDTSLYNMQVDDEVNGNARSYSIEHK